MSVSDTTPEIRMAMPTVTANSVEYPPDESAHEENGNEDSRQRHGHRYDREGNLATAVERGLHSRATFFPVAHDVFKNDDGVVNDEPNSECERHQREIVEAETCELHHGECAHDRRGQREIAPMRVARRVPRNMNITSTTSAVASSSVVRTSLSTPSMKSPRL